jgi:hypothetical protein
MKTNAEKINYCRQHIEAIKASGLTRKAYCEKNEIKISTLDYWCQKPKPLGKQARLRKPSTRQSRTSAKSSAVGQSPKICR